MLPLDALVRNTGINFMQKAYLLICGVVRFALTNFGNNQLSNGTAKIIEEFLLGIKKESAKFRKLSLARHLDI